MTANILAAAAAFITFFFVFYLLRRGALREKYAVLWLFFSGAALFFAIFPGALVWFSNLIGVAQPVNLLFFVTVVLLVLVAVQLSYELSRHEMRIRRLAEEVALLRDEIADMKRSTDGD
jgi:hypothetical protein